MQDPVLQLTGVVSDALAASMFCPTGSTVIREHYSPSQIRQLHAEAVCGRIHYPTIYLYQMDARTDPEKLAPLVDMLRSQLAPVIDDTGLVNLLEEKMTPEDLSVATLRAAAILSPKEAASAIHHWLSGGPWIETVHFTLTGITVSEPGFVRSGARFERLPQEPKDVFGRIPNMLALALQGSPILRRDDFLGSTVVSYEDSYRPVLRNANQNPGVDRESTFPRNWTNGFIHFLDALSLATNAPVVHQYSWRTMSPVQLAFYVRGAEGWGQPPAVHWPRGSAVELTGPLVEQALRLADKLQAVAERQRVGLTFDRWMNSLRRQHYVNDQLIEIRIALESLYAARGTHEASLRVAYHGARHLGRNLEERKALYKDLKAIYDTASAVIHGRPPKNSKTARNLVSRGQDIIRDALLKILEDGKIPDWTDLILEDR